MAFPANRFFILLLSFSCLCFPANALCNPQDHRNLLASFSSHPSNLLDWSSHDCCGWEGVACDSNGRVTHLWLPNKTLKGAISIPLTNLAHLTHLNLSMNTLTGLLPDGFFHSLRLLKTLDLSYNNLQGELPSSLFIPHHVPRGSIAGNFFKLEILRMNANNFSGNIPKEIYSITTLQELHLALNKLHGPISPDISNLTSLLVLKLHFNRLSGGIPWELGKLSKLKDLVLGGNLHLNGTIPASLMNCTQLTRFILSRNALEGALSSQNFSSLTKLEILDLSENYFVGEFPSSLYDCRSLTAIRLSINPMRVQITLRMQALHALSFLGLGSTGLTNIKETMRILMGCKNLAVLTLDYNFQDEIMPDDHDIGTPSEQNNAFHNLKFLSIGFCNLKGQVPAWLENVGSLQLLFLQFNRLTGTIPGWMGSHPSLRYIDLTHNLIDGEIPQTLYGLRALTSDKFLQDNRTFELPIFFSFNYTIDTSFGQLNRFSDIPPTIILGSNRLSGIISKGINQLKFLRKLDLSNNNFSGCIPKEISKLTKLEELDLSRNNFFGKIPESLADITSLRKLDVSYNNLQGSIPQGTQLQSFGAVAYEGNKQLCGQPLPNPCPAAGVNEGSELDDGKSGNTVLPEYISIGLGFGIGFSTVCYTLWWSKSWRNAYFQFLTSIKDGLYETVATIMARIGRS